MTKAETPRPMLVNMSDTQLAKIEHMAKYGERSQFVRDAVDAYKGPFVPSDEEFAKVLPATMCRFFKAQRAKICKESKKGYRSQYIRDAIDAFAPATAS